MTILKIKTPAIRFCLVCLLLIAGCTSKEKQNRTEHIETTSDTSHNEGYSITFYKIDDFVKVYLDEELILDSSVQYGMAPKHDVTIDLNEYLHKGKNELKVEIHNAECASCNQNRWDVVYEILKDGESVDYFTENSNDLSGEIGLQASSTHQLTL